MIGKGGMSEVYLAIDKNLNKQWAVKEIKKRAKDRNNAVVVQSAIAEANMMKKLDHPCLPRIVDIIADKHVDDFNKIHKPLDKRQELGYTDLKGGKNNAVDFSNSDYILKTETGEVIEIKINATGSTKADYELAKKLFKKSMT